MEIQRERKKEDEQNVYLDRIDRIVKQIQIQMKSPSTPSTDVKTAEGFSAKTKLLINTINTIMLKYNVYNR